MMREEILKDLLNDIVGRDCKYDDKYLIIELEIDKISSVTQEVCDYRNIINNCEYLLSKETKDFKLASWWFYANFKINSIEGIKYAIDYFINFINKFSESFYPKTNNSRLNIIDWLELNLSKDFENNLDLKNGFKNTNLHEKFLELSKTFSKLGEENKEYFKDIIKISKPSIIEIVKNLEEEKNNDVTTDFKEKVDNLVKQDNKIDEILTDSDANKVLQDIRKRMSKLSNYYRKNDFSNFKSLRITRFLFLLDFEDLPISSGKRTSIYPPLVTDIDLIESLMKQNKNSELLILAEEILEDCPFWLDGHFYTYKALMNTNFTKQAEEIKANFVNFVNANKQVLNLTFIEDTPFVSLKTKNWIEKEKKDKTVEKVENKKDDDIFFEKIDNFISNNNINEAVYIFEERINLAKNFEDKFIWKLKFSEFILEIGKKDIAKIFLEELMNHIQYFNLLDWNPKLATSVYILVLNNSSSLEYDQTSIDSIYRSLCKIDIKKALEINLN